MPEIEVGVIYACDKQVNMFNLNSFIMPVFECRLKQDRLDLKKGTTIRVSTSAASCDAYKIADECERLFGKKARSISFPGYWDIKKL